MKMKDKISTAAAVMVLVAVLGLILFGEISVYRHSVNNTPEIVKIQKHRAAEAFASNSPEIIYDVYTLKEYTLALKEAHKKGYALTDIRKYNRCAFLYFEKKKD